jgi:uncharacterized repeat protein (TIGR01451 family)
MNFEGFLAGIHIPELQSGLTSLISMSVRGRRSTRFALAVFLFPALLFGQTPSSTSLIASPNPANYGQPVTLTATVTAGATGKVTFYDGVTILGVGTLSGTQASVTTVMLPSGSRKLRAYYQGDGTYGPSSSAVLPQTVVAGASLGLNPPASYQTSAQPCSLALADFNNDGRPDAAITDLNGRLTIYLGNGDGTFRNAASYMLGGVSCTLAVADFNGDGKADVVFGSGVNPAAGLMLGNGDGTFQPSTTVYADYIGGLAVADFDGDGNADLAITVANAVVILLGKGDGTFQKPKMSTMGDPNEAVAIAVAVADLNNDGKPDLVAGPGYSVAILLGNGDGTFQLPVTVVPPVLNIDSLQTADLNLDGNADIVVNTGGAITVLIGHGNGTFTALQPMEGLDSQAADVIADFNGDGIPDLAFINVANYSAGGPYMAIAPGNGDGTFGSLIYCPVGTGFGYVTAAASADFNGDGKADIFIVSGSSPMYDVMLGGAEPDLTLAVTDGGFTQAQQGAKYFITVSNAGTFASTGTVKVIGSLPSGLTAISMSGTGWSCVLASLQCTRSDSLGSTLSYASITLVANFANGLTGSVTSTFTVSGGGEVNLANDSASVTHFLRNPSTLTLTPTANPSLLGQPVTLVATITAGATGRVEFFAGTTGLGFATIASGQATMATSLLPSGANPLQAIYYGDSNFGPSTATQTEVVNALTNNGFEPYSSTAIPSGFRLIATGDFNGDGNADLVVGSFSAESGISVLLGNGDGTFREPVNYTLGGGASPSNLVVGDFNNDGKPDIAVTTTYGLLIYLSNGDGTFQVVGTLNTRSPNDYSGLAAADFNGDGNLDLVGIYANNQVVPTIPTVTVLLGNGDGTFQPPIQLPESGIVYSYATAADMNRDGIPDIVATGSDSVVSVFLGNGDGTFGSAISLSFNSTDVGTVLVGDFNGDGKPDVAVTDYVALGNGDGTLQTPIPMNIIGIEPYLVGAGDFNGDGRLDVVYNSIDGPGDTILFGNGDGTFRQGPALPLGPIAWADFNRDGRLDLAAIVSNSIEVFLGGQFSGLLVSSTHTGSFTAGQTGTYQLTAINPLLAAITGTVTVTDTLPAGLTAASISGTGWTCTLIPLSCARSDGLAAGTNFPAITLSVNVGASLPPSVLNNQASVTNSGNGSSATDPTTIILSTTTMLTAQPDPSTLGQPTTLSATVTAGATGNVLFLDNGLPVGNAPIASGHAELSTALLPSGLQGLTAIYPGDVTHAPSISPIISQPVDSVKATTFALPITTYSTGAGPISIAVGDFNHDGFADLVTANYTANTVSVLLGHGDGTFARNADYSAGTQPEQVVVADFNNDGNQDLAVANSQSENISIFLGKSDGTFQSATNTTLPGWPSWFAVSDFNGDGKPDLVVLIGNTSVIVVLLGNGDGTFTQTQTYNCPCQNGLIGDFNRDGKTDILVSPGYIYLGNGDGTFQWTNDSADISFEIGAAGDINGDGKLDVIADVSNGVEVFLGNGDGTFQAGVQYPSPICCAPSAILLADVNGDGKLDVVMSNPGIKNVYVLYGNGDGTLQPAISYSVTGPYAVVAGDFNGDGRTDLAVANEGGADVEVLLGVVPASLSVSSTHSDPFSLGQTGATYTIAVSNTGPGATSGQITVTDALPWALTATGIAGSGWNCTLATLTCTSTASIPVGQSCPTITVTVSVTGTTTGSIANLVSVSGANVVSTNASDPTNIVGTAITIQTNPAGLQFSLDGTPQTAPQTINLAPGTHTLSVTSPQNAPGTQYLFTTWSDSPAASRTITVGTTPATYTATFQTQYQLTTAADPPSGGAVTPTAFYNAGTSASITATANPPLIFTGWSNGATANPLPVTMNAPTNLTAYFDIPGATCTMTGDSSASVADVQYIVNEALGVIPANNDLNGDGVVNITDIQQVAGAVLHSSCLL